LGAVVSKYYYTKDHTGSVRDLTDATGNVQTKYDYDPYGRRTTLPGNTADTVISYTGHHWHEKSGVYLTMFRQYDPELGRWLSRDPLGEEEGDGPNLYGYVLNSPINGIDPLGLAVVAKDKKDHEKILEDLGKTFKGNLSFNEDGNLSRTKTDKDTAYDQMLDTLIGSEAIYTINPNAYRSYYRPNTKNGEKFYYWETPQSHLSRGGEINYNDVIDSYPQNIFTSGEKGRLNSDFTNGASKLGHEIARAYSHEKGEPQTNDARAKQTTVDRSREAYTRQGKRPRIYYQW